MKKDNIDPEDPNDVNDLSELLGAPEGEFMTPGKENYPDVLPIIVITNRPYTPYMAVPIVIEPGPYLELLQEISKNDSKYIGLVMSKDKDQDIYDATLDEIYEVGVVAKILRIHKVADGKSNSSGAQVILNIEQRFKITGLATKKKSKHLLAKVKYHKESVPSDKKDIVKAYTASLIKTIKEILTYNPTFSDELSIVLSHSEFAQPYKLCDFAVCLTTASREDLQDILSTFDLLKRMEKALILLKKELDISKLQQMINAKIEGTISVAQREYHLREQLKAIQKELNINKDDKTVDAEKFEERSKKLKFTDEAQKVFKEELEKLSVLDVQSAEYSVVRSYLDWLTSLPWGIYDKENESLAKAEAVLEADHYGLKDVKERIAEVIAGNLLNKSGSGSIICLVGPPGVGKTSIGKSIAKALNRRFCRFSVGGLSDESEIKGHRRTYVGSLPGKIIQELKKANASNPLMLIDEIDKITSSNHGDPSSALLEVLDPEQNNEFLDHYLDVRFDLSKVLFVVTANTLETIPGPLLDRMEVIRISGYVEQEKVEIAKKYLLTKCRKELGLKSTDVHFSSKALHHVIRSYCRESGVRNLEKSIKKIMRKVATAKVRELESKEKKKKEIKKKSINIKEVEEYLGLPIFTSEKFYAKEKMAGVASGLAWTSMGGSMLYIEAVKNPGKNRIKLTGNSGDVMKESSMIAYTYLVSEQEKYIPNGVSFDAEEIHLHIPDGATPKDGPSAGITLTTAMISLCTGRAVSHDLAMTGELTIKGKVLPIGGLKEKIIAAKRENIHNIIYPKDNERDLNELDDYLKRGMKFYPVSHYDEVHKIAFGKGMDRKKKPDGRRVK